MRMSTRSLASRLDSGSSNRNSLRVAHQRPAHGDALALAAGKLARLALEQMADLQHLGDLVDRLLALLGFGTPRISMPKEMFPATVMFG